MVFFRNDLLRVHAGGAYSAAESLAAVFEFHALFLHQVRNALHELQVFFGGS